MIFLILVVVTGVEIAISYMEGIGAERRDRRAAAALRDR